MLCPGCGNEIDPSEECPICAEVREKRRRGRQNDPLATRFCPSCGNEIYGEGVCSICTSGHAIQGRKAKRSVLCPGCGNEVEDIHQCPICKDGRAIGGAAEASRDEGPACPSCDELLSEEDFDGAQAWICGSCQGMFFAPNALEAMLDRLRENDEEQDLATVLQEFRDRRFAVKGKVRYRSCPVCGLSMTRRNYAGVSGIIIDLCGPHGVWVDQSTFGELSDFVTKGGDLFAARSPLAKEKSRPGRR